MFRILLGVLVGLCLVAGAALVTAQAQTLLQESIAPYPFVAIDDMG